MLKNKIVAIAVLFILISIPIVSAESEFIITLNGPPVEIDDDGNKFYYMQDADGHITQKIDENGNVVERYKSYQLIEVKEKTELPTRAVSGCDIDVSTCDNIDMSTGQEISNAPRIEFPKEDLPSAEPLDYPESLWAFEHQGYDLATTPEVGSETPYKPNTWKWLESLTPEQRQEYADKGIYRHFLGESLKISYQLAFMSMYAKAATTPPQPTRGNLVRQGILGRTSQNQAALRFLAAHTTTPTSMAESKYAYITRYANDEELMEYARRGYVFHPKGETLYVTPDYYSSASAAHGPLALPGEIRQGFVRISTRHLSGIPAVDATVVQSQTQTFGPHAVGGGLEIAFPPGTTIPLK